MEKTDLSKQEYLSKAQDYCARAEKCASEVINHLYRWGCPEEWHRDILDQLYKDKYIDDERYALAYTHDKLRFQGWGRIKIRMMLHGLRVDDEAIHTAIESIDEIEYFNQLRKIMVQHPKPTLQQTIRFLLQRGFTQGEIEQVLKEK